MPDITLAQGEKILWVGQAAKTWKSMLSGPDIILTLSSLTGTGFVVFICMWFLKELTAPSLGIVIFLTVFLTVLGISLLYFSFGRFIYKYYRYKNTYYIVTNKRLVIKNTRSERLKNIDIDKIAVEYYINRKVKKDLRGSILLLNKAAVKKYINRFFGGNMDNLNIDWLFWYARISMEAGLEIMGKVRFQNYFYINTFAFLNIDGAEEVYQLITGLMAGEDGGKILMNDKVTEIINQWDPMDLFPHAPVDEYSPEIREICSCMKNNALLTPNALGQKILEIFQMYFGNDNFRKSPDQCTKIAEKILRETTEIY